MNDPGNVAFLHGALSVLLGGALAAAVWFFAIHKGRTSNKWLYGLRFTLWSVAAASFTLGASLSRLMLRIPESPWGTTLGDRLKGVLGVWVLAFPILFPLGAWIGSRKNPKASDGAAPH